MKTKNKKGGGRVFIISAPSGCGKTTLCDKLLKTDAGLAQSISATTRPPRRGETDGKDYHFIPRHEFQRRIRAGEFLEWTRTYGWYYGTPGRFVTETLKKGRDILLSIDVKGALKVRKIYPDSVLIFILPPSLKELEKRLRSRNSDDKKEIQKRLKIVKREMALARKYDYTVINDNVNRAVGRLEAIVESEKIARGEGR